MMLRIINCSICIIFHFMYGIIFSKIMWHWIYVNDDVFVYHFYFCWSMLLNSNSSECYGWRVSILLFIKGFEDYVVIFLAHGIEITFQHLFLSFFLNRGDEITKLQMGSDLLLRFDDDERLDKLVHLLLLQFLASHQQLEGLLGLGVGLLSLECTTLGGGTWKPHMLEHLVTRWSNVWILDQTQSNEFSSFNTQIFPILFWEVQVLESNALLDLFLIFSIKWLFPWKNDEK